MAMTFEAWSTILVVVATIIALAATRIAPDLILVASLTALLLAGILTPNEALLGLSNPGLATVGVLYVVVSGLTETGAINVVGERLLGRPKSDRSAQLRLMLPVVGLSAFLNNTPVVAMLVPAVQDWAKRYRMSVSKLMIPLSYAAIFGGMCTVIGTSTNLVVSGLWTQTTDLAPLGFFEVGWIGVPCAVAGLAFLLGTSRWLLPVRKPPIQEAPDAKEYAVEMLVENASSLVGRSIEQAGLRHLTGVYLAEIERNGSVLPAVPPTEVLRGGDRLVFVGMVDSVVDLYRIRGLIPAPDQVFKLDSPRPERRLIEAVVSGTCPVVGKTIRDGRFRSLYDAVVVAVARGGKRVSGKIGDIELEAGDTLLIEARPSFVAQQRQSRDFLLVSAIEGAAPPRHDRAWVAGLTLLGMIAAATLLESSMLVAAMVAAGLMLATRCTTASAARRSVDWQVLTVIGAAFGLGAALQKTGAAGSVAQAWVGIAGDNPWLALIAVYAITNLLTEVITNNAAAVLAFPIAAATADSLDVNFRPFVFAIMIAASASFSTPIGYQTNLMVYGPGGYRFSDYLRIGVPLNLLMGAIAVLLAPLLWPF